MTDQELRTYAFLAIIGVVVIAEFIIPKRALTQNKTKRWFNNLALIGLDTIIIRLLLPAGAIGVATWVQLHGFGLFQILKWDGALSIFLTIILLDMIIYWQHRLFHLVPFLWCLHQVHHADRDIDVTTGLRFHPVEIIISMFIKFAVILTLGVPVMAVVLFEIILNGMAMFNHGNYDLPKFMDNVIRTLFVTPDMHRVHHSVLKHETNSNYGFNLSVWDKLFGSYHAQPDLGHEKMTIGLEQYQGKQDTSSIFWMLTLPFNHIGRHCAQSETSKTKEKA